MSDLIHTDDELHIVDDGADFFAPVAHDVIDGLLGAYQQSRARIEVLAEYVRGPEAASVIHYFMQGNSSSERSGRSMELSAAQLFDVDGAVGALNAAYWSKALQLTDVLDIMPQARRTEWHEQMRNPAGKWKDYHTTQRDKHSHPEWFDEEGKYIDEANAYALQPLPQFESDTVRNTLAALLNMRAQFLGERVDGIFRGLSGEHVTNVPEGFSKRMIIRYYGSHDREGLINDLRCVIAKFMGRDEPKWHVTSDLLRRLRGESGVLHVLDGGTLRMRVYKCGTAHLEVHPDMAWRLNQVLASLYPLAIPAEFRQRPKRKTKAVNLIKRPLPNAVLAVIAGLKSSKEKVMHGWRESYQNIPNTIAFYGSSDMDKHVADEVRNVLTALGGTTDARGLQWNFDYSPWEAINEVIISGCIPDAKAHQFYPTRERLARMAFDFAAEGAAPDATWCEPSAGMGGLADYMPKDRTTCVEVSSLHCKVLEAKGFATICADFLAWAEEPGRAGSFARVVMNPPFDRSQWRAHLEHAAALVRAGGRLVAILPSGARGTALPGFNTTWHGPYSNEFPGASVEVVILVADRV